MPKAAFEFKQFPAAFFPVIATKVSPSRSSCCQISLQLINNPSPPSMTMNQGQKLCFYADCAWLHHEQGYRMHLDNIQEWIISGRLPRRNWQSWQPVAKVGHSCSPASEVRDFDEVQMQPCLDLEPEFEANLDVTMFHISRKTSVDNWSQKSVVGYMMMLHLFDCWGIWVQFFNLSIGICHWRRKSSRKKSTGWHRFGAELVRRSVRHLAPAFSPSIPPLDSQARHLGPDGRSIGKKWLHPV